MEISRGFQNKNLNMMHVLDRDKKLTVGFYGVTGSFSEEALKEYFGEKVDTKAISEFEDIFLDLRIWKNKLWCYSYRKFFHRSNI